MGRSEAGKTSLTQALKGEKLHYVKTQYTNTDDDTIDSPGEYAESKHFSVGLACFSFEADVVAMVQSISISKAASASASGLHEVGESVNVGTATIGKTAGKFNNNGWTTPAQPAAAFTWSNEKMSSILTNGAEGYAAQTDVASIAQGTAKTVKGTNKVTITATADYSAPTNKPITNLKSEYGGEDATWVAGTATKTATVEWTGVYPCFANTKSLGTEPNEKLALQSDVKFSFTVPAHNAGNNDFRFAYPDGWTISSFKVKSLDGTYKEFAAAHNKNAGDLAKTIQGNAVTYHYLTVENGASDYQIILNKGLNA